MEDKIIIDWSFSCMEMLAELHEYILEKNGEKTADKYIDGIFKTIEKLEKFPEACGPCRNAILKEHGYRCCLYKSHILIYEFAKERISILAIIHSRRNPTKISDIIT